MTAHDLSISALAETGQRLAHLDEDLAFLTTVPTEAGWTTLEAATRPDAIADLATDILSETGHHAAAASYLAARLTQPVVSRSVAAVLLDRRCPALSPPHVALHRSKNKFDHVAFTGSWAIVSGDVGPLEPGVVEVSDPEALRSWWARNLVAGLTPVFEASRARLRFARRGLWSLVATRVGSTATALDRLRGGSGEAGWAEAAHLLDALQEHAPVRLTRPTPLPVVYGGDTLWHTTKATCCLKYHTKTHVDRSNGLGHCSTCPLVERECRVAQLVAKIAQHRSI